MAEQQGRALQKAIRDRIRNLRIQKGWSLDKLSEITGLSKSYLSQIENGEKNPPISTLTKIAFGLGEDIAWLITGERRDSEPAKLSIVRAHERQPIIHPNAPAGYAYESVSYRKADRSMDAYIVTLGPELPADPLNHEGQELTFALEGRHEFLYDQQSMIVEPGDCLYFDSDRPHAARSLDNRRARVLVVFNNPLRAT